MDGSVPASEIKKRNCEEIEESGHKRAKTRDLESVFRSEGKTKKGIPSTVDLIGKVNHLATDDAPPCIQDPIKPSSLELNFQKPGGFRLDLNSENVSVSINHNPFHPEKNHKHVKSQDTLSQCGSTRCSHGGKDSMRVWNEMKRNGFLSSSHKPSIPKPRGRKKGKESEIKKSIEIAKREQADRFAKVAAPSGLLNELNPGIINHVRNSKQVHSIIENLVRSSRTKNKGFCKVKGLENEIWDRSSLCQSDEVIGDGDLGRGDDILTMKLSLGATVGPENLSSLSNEETGNSSTVDSLSLRAASIASQWLELLRQDIKGRLAALRSSRERVGAVIHTELPFLISSELSSNQEIMSSENGDLHRIRWNALFEQMDKSLSEEETHLENSLNQVREMLVHCEHGLFQFHQGNGFQPQDTLENDYRLAKAEPGRDLAVRAAAAAIYSTSNFLQSTENLSCF